MPDTKRVAVLGAAESWYFRDLQRASESCGSQLVALPFSTVGVGFGGVDPWFHAADEVDLSDFDAILVRSMPPGTLEQIVFRMNALHRLEAAGGRIVNPPRCLEIAIDKDLASALLEEAGLTTPRTIVAQTMDDAMRGFQSLGQDVVVKPLFGSEGKGITRITDTAIAWRTFKALASIGAVIYLQRFIANPGYDLRLLVIGKEIYGMKRKTVDDWRTNISLGGQAERIDVDAALAQIAFQAAEAVNAPLLAVDVLPGDDGEKYILEVNAVPGWRALSRALDVDIAAQVLRFLAH